MQKLADADGLRRWTEERVKTATHLTTHDNLDVAKPLNHYRMFIRVYLIPSLYKVNFSCVSNLNALDGRTHSNHGVSEGVC